MIAMASCSMKLSGCYPAEKRIPECIQLSPKHPSMKLG